MQTRPRIKSNASASERIVFSFILASFFFALTVIPIRVIFDDAYRNATEYRIILFQLAVGTFSLWLPRTVAKHTGAIIPSRLVIAYMLFMWFSMFLGEFAMFYYRVAVWDVFLHLYSAVLLTLLGLSVPRLLSGKEESAAVTALFALSFSVLIGVLWEIYEFAFDGILGLNMQKFAIPSAGVEKLSPLIGRAALSDTMTDLICDLISSLAVAIWGFFRLIRHGSLPAGLKIIKVTS